LSLIRTVSSSAISLMLRIRSTMGVSRVIRIEMKPAMLREEKPVLSRA
jgi:hypothetical protein